MLGTMTSPFSMLLLLVVAVIGSAHVHADTLLAQNPADLTLTGGATVVAAPLNALRSGNPGQHTTASFVAPLTPGAELQSIEFEYRYDTGFGSAGAGIGSNFTVSLAGTSLYQSPHLKDYSYSNRTNYSTPIPVHTDGLSVTVPKDGKAYHLEISFDNNDRNMQLLLPLSIKITCSGVRCLKSKPPQANKLAFTLTLTLTLIG